jgi:hypothetical protein
MIILQWEISWEGVDGVHLAEKNMDQWLTVVNTVLNLRLPQMAAGNFLASCEHCQFVKKGSGVKLKKAQLSLLGVGKRRDSGKFTPSFSFICSLFVSFSRNQTYFFGT